MQIEFRALYPFKTVTASALSETHLHADKVTIEQDEVDAIADSIEVDKDLLSRCFEIVKRFNALTPLFICRSNPLVQRIRSVQSIFFVPTQNQKRVFITLYESAGHNTGDKKSVIRILHSFMLLFDAQGTFQQKVDTVSFLTKHTPGEKGELNRSQQKVMVRLSNTQTLGYQEYFPECFSFIDYSGKKGEKKIIYFQKRAYSNLRTYLERNSRIFATENSELMMLIIARKILQALIFMHQKGLMHKDVKCENVLLEEEPEYTPTPQPLVRITDFDRSCKFSDIDGRFRLEGTLDWMAPELSSQNRFMQGVEQEAWSTGLVLHMLSGANGQAKVHKLREKKNDYTNEFVNLLKRRAGIEQALHRSPTEYLHNELAALNLECTKLKQMIEEQEKKLQSAIDTLPWPDKIKNLRHVAERMIQKEQQKRISFETALTEVEHLINQINLHSLQIEKA